MKGLNEAEKRIVRLKNFESSLLELRRSIRNIKHDYRRNVKETSCDKMKRAYKKKVEDYTVKELNYILNMIENIV